MNRRQDTCADAEGAARRRATACKAGAAVVAAGVLLAAAGCSRTDHRIPDAAPAMPRELYQPYVGGTSQPEGLMERPAYRINIGDVLEIIYHVKNVPTPGGYRIKIEDVINIEFPWQEKFNQQRTVQGDGKIRALLVGDISAAGMTAKEIEDQLKAAYSVHIKDPEILVTVAAANVKIAELKKAITTAPRGQSRLVPVKSDGTIDLPYVGELMAAGRTVREVKSWLDRMYIENDLEEVEVTVQMLEFAPRRIYVMGEVLQPGMIESNLPITLVQSIVTAGGPNVRADQAKILVIRRDLLPLPQAVVVDLASLLSGWQAGPEGRLPDGSAWRHDFYMANGDIVYIPPTDLAKATDWIDQVFTRGIRSVFPYSGNVGVNFGYELRNAPVTVKNRSIGPPNVSTQVGP